MTPPRVISSGGQLLIGVLVAVGGAAQEAKPPRPASSPQRGATDYATLCSGCHGSQLEGSSASSLVDREWSYGGDDESVLASIRGGRPETPMLPFGELIEEERIQDLLFFIRFQEAYVHYRPTPPVNPDGVVIGSELQAFRVEVVARDLDTPWALAFLPGGDLLVSERSGRLSVIPRGQLTPVPIRGTPEPRVVQDAGYFDVELHPQYERNGWIYLAYAAPHGVRASMTRIVRGRLRDGAWIDEEAVYDPPAALFGTETVHYGCRLLFDASGRLLFTIGDRGQPERAQDLASPFGKIHRVTDDGGVPDDNPWAKRKGVVPTIWSYGHRNPQGLSFDPASGALWEAEHGPVGGDELNVIEPGRNYGWARISHGLDRGVARVSQRREKGTKRIDGLELAVRYWTPAIAPSGIHFYTGEAYPRWRGHLFVTGLAGTALRRLEVRDGAVLAEEVLFDRFGRVRDVVTGPDDLLYVAVQTPGPRLSAATPGLVLRLVPRDW